MARSSGRWAAFGSAGGTSSSDSSSALMSSGTAGSFRGWFRWWFSGAGEVVLDCMADGSVGGSVAVVGAAAFHHFEEHTAHGGGVEMEEFPAGVPVIQEVQLLEDGQESRFKVEAGV